MMMSWIGALVALAARVNRSPGLEWAREKRLEAERDALVRSRAQLIDHVELLERELAVERRMSEHWLRECQRTIRERREIEDERDSLRTRLDAALSPGAQRAAQIHALQAQAEMAQYRQAELQAVQAIALGGQHAAQYALQQDARLAEQAMLQAQQNAANVQCQGYRNCTPGRSQVLQAALNRLNQT